MNKLQKALNETIKEIPNRMLRELLATKLQEEGIKPSKKLLDALMEHIRSESTDTFSWDDGKKSKNKSIALSVSDDELQELQRKIANFLEEGLPKIVQDTSRSTAKSVLDTLIKQWPEQYAWEQEQIGGFRYRIDERWGVPINLLRMLLTIVMEAAAELQKENKRKKRGKTQAYNLLLWQHCRACQVTSEIITLLESGYADGAMARWRTLHEIGTISAVIEHFGEDIAERYIAHEVVESKRALDDFERCHASLGYYPPSEKDKKAMQEQYGIVISKYGDDFKEPYGWANQHIPKTKNRALTLYNLEAAAGKEVMRAHYQMASYNVHASPKGLFFRLGLLPNFDGIHSGASNAGLEEPGQNTAFTLVQLTGLLFCEKMNFDEIVQLSLLVQLRDRIAEELEKAARKLQRDEAAFHKKRTRK